MQFNKLLGLTSLVAGFVFAASAYAETASVPAPVVNLTANNYQDMVVAGQIPAPQPEEKMASAVAVMPTATPEIAASELTERVNVLESQMQNLTRMDLLGKIAALQTQVQTLTGELDVQAHKMQKLAQQQRDFYRDIDARLAKKSTEANRTIATTQPHAVKAVTPITTATPANKSVAAKTKPQAPGSATEQDTYRAALIQLKRRQVGKAKAGFEDYLKHYPKGEYAVNAHYWLGELYSIDKDNKRAIEQFNIVVKQYPDSSKVDDALLKLGFIHASEGDVDLAKKQLQQVIKQFPNTTASRLANLRLRTLKAQTASKADAKKTTTTAESAKAKGS